VNRNILCQFYKVMSIAPMWFSTNSTYKYS